MNRILKEVLSGNDIPNYLHPFTGLGAEEDYDTVRERILHLKRIGVRSMNLLWHGNMEDKSFVPFRSEKYWTRIGWVADICREQEMTFMMQDAAPFPTGRADGALEQEENLDKNKLFLGERHLDVKGPIQEGCFLITDLVGSLRGADQHDKFGKARPFPGDKLYAVVAVPRKEGNYYPAEAMDLTDQVQDGLLLWAVPEGIWRIFVIFETHNDGGRRYYMDLLNPASVALNIETIYQPHYEHLKEEIGKTWLGFFYDEAEMGNLLEYCCQTLPGMKRNFEGESLALPWSAQAADSWRDIWQQDYRKVLPLLWEQDDNEYHRVRYLYMDMISRIVQETYNKVMHEWCKKHNLQYIGHNLEDENTHSTLGTGPAHYFRMQAHQDVAGIDLIGGQLMPGKDFVQSWYGCADGDGEFYHYGIAKLASSAAHINPITNGRSFCEVFAVYGTIAGSRLRKYVYDHLLINGINEMISSPPAIPGVEEEFSREENHYVNRMCHLLHRTRPVIKTAVLYHAEAEWYQGDFQRFQTPAGELARHQISYDVIPADVFTQQDFYRTDTSKGLTINGNVYEAFVIPAAEALPESVYQFLRTAKQTKFPVLFCDKKPSVIAETGSPCGELYGEEVARTDLSEVLGKMIEYDIVLRHENPNIRYSHYTSEEGEFYLLLNEGKRTEITASFPCRKKIYSIDMMRKTIERLDSVEEENVCSCQFVMEELESRVLFLAEEELTEVRPVERLVEKGFTTSWKVSLQNGTVFETDKLVNINSAAYYPRYTGKVTYETGAEWREVPEKLSLGDVYQMCRLYINGKLAGTAQNSPYSFDIASYAVQGHNDILLEVYTGIARKKAEADTSSFGHSMSASVYNSLEPGGLMGPVTLYFKEK